MASLDDLPLDQRAVLQLILQRGRSYDEIATLLSIDRAAVRERALAALDAIGPQMGVTGERRGLVGDYLLGQLDASAIAAARQHIAESPSERAWARVLASELAPLASEPLPEIPSAATPAVANQHAPIVAAMAAADEAEERAERSRRGRRGRGRRGRAAPETPAPAAARERVAAASGRAEPGAAPATPPPAGPIGADPGPPPRRSSRLGGMILIALTVVIVAVVAIFALASGDSHHPKPASAPTSATTAATGGSTTATTSSAAKAVAQINLTSPSGHSKAVGIAEVLQESGKEGIAIVAQHVTPNTSKPPNAYAVWLYNSATDAQILGFVNPGVGKNGRLSTAGGLPTNASHFKQLIVTVETKANPKTPGTIVLQGPLNGV